MFRKYLIFFFSSNWNRCKWLLWKQLWWFGVWFVFFFPKAILSIVIPIFQMLKIIQHSVSRWITWEVRCATLIHIISPCISWEDLWPVPFFLWWSCRCMFTCFLMTSLDAESNLQAHYRRSTTEAGEWCVILNISGKGGEEEGGGKSCHLMSVIILSDHRIR